MLCLKDARSRFAVTAAPSTGLFEFRRSTQMNLEPYNLQAGTGVFRWSVFKSAFPHWGFSDELFFNRFIIL